MATTPTPDYPALDKWFHTRLRTEYLASGAGDVDIEPVVRIQPGDTVTAETDDFAGGQITRDATAADLPKLDFDLIYRRATSRRAAV